MLTDLTETYSIKKLLEVRSLSFSNLLCGTLSSFRGLLSQLLFVRGSGKFRSLDSGPEFRIQKMDPDCLMGSADTPIVQEGRGENSRFYTLLVSRQLIVPDERQIFSTT